MWTLFFDIIFVKKMSHGLSCWVLFSDWMVYALVRVKSCEPLLHWYIHWWDLSGCQCKKLGWLYFVVSTTCSQLLCSSLPGTVRQRSWDKLPWSLSDMMVALGVGCYLFLECGAIQSIWRCREHTVKAFTRWRQEGQALQAWRSDDQRLTALQCALEFCQRCLASYWSHSLRVFRRH